MNGVVINFMEAKAKLPVHLSLDYDPLVSSVFHFISTYSNLDDVDKVYSDSINNLYLLTEGGRILHNNFMELFSPPNYDFIDLSSNSGWDHNWSTVPYSISDKDLCSKLSEIASKYRDVGGIKDFTEQKLFSFGNYLHIDQFITFLRTGIIDSIYKFPSREESMSMNKLDLDFMSYIRDPTKLYFKPTFDGWDAGIRK